MGEGQGNTSAFEDAEASRIKALEAKLASPEMQGMAVAKYWPRQAVFNEILDVRLARTRRRIEENWVT